MRAKAGKIAGLGLLLLVFGALAWLNGRADSAHLRLILAGVVVVLAGALLWQRRKSLWWPPLIVAGALAALVLVYLTAPDVNLAIFEQFMALAIGAVFVWLLVWILARCVLPRTDAKYQALPILILSCALSIGLLASSAGTWLKAVDLNALPGNPVAETGAELAALWEQPWGTRHRGIFAAGVIGDPEKRRDGGGDFLAYFNAGRFGALASRSPTRFPLSFELRMADGAVVWVRGIAQAARTSGWPRCGPYFDQRCVREGDPVVIWADPGERRAVGGGGRGHALTDTRVIAYGSLEDFRQGYLARAVATARVFGWIGFAFIPLSLVPAILGYRRARWLRRNGSDRVPAGGAKWIR